MARDDWVEASRNGEIRFERDDRNLLIAESSMYLTSEQKARGMKPERYRVLVNSNKGGHRFNVPGVGINGGNFTSLKEAMKVAEKYMEKN